MLFSFKAPIEVEVHTDDLILCSARQAQVKETMAAMPQLADVETTPAAWRAGGAGGLRPRSAGPLRTEPRQVARLVRDKVQGFEATRFNLKDRRIPIVVRLRMEDRRDRRRRQLADHQSRRRTANPLCPPWPTVESSPKGPARSAESTAAGSPWSTANIASGSLGSAVEAFERRAQRSRLALRHDILHLGQNEEWERSRAACGLALALSIFLVYVIMAAQFESLLASRWSSCSPFRWRSSAP